MTANQGQEGSPMVKVPESRAPSPPYLFKSPVCHRETPMQSLEDNRSVRKSVFVLSLALALLSLATLSTGAPTDEFERAVELYEGRKLDEALALFEKLVAKNPQDGESWLWIGTILIEKGEFKEAAGALQKAIQLSLSASLQATALVNLGVAYQSFGEPIAKAVDCYEKAIRLKPDLMEAHSYLITVYIGAGQWREAQKAAERAFSILGRPLPSDRIKATWDQVVAFLADDYDRALDMLKSLALQQWANPEFQYLTGRANEGVGQFSRAALFFGQAAALAPQVADYHLSFGRVLGKMGLWRQAVKPLERAVALSGDGVGPVVQLAQAYGAVGRWSDSVVLLKRIAEREPHNVTVWQSLAFATLQLGREEEALELFRKALSLKDDPVIAVNVSALELNAGSRLITQGQWDHAATLIEAATDRLSLAVTKHPSLAARLNFLKGLRLLATVKKALGQEQEAQKLVARAKDFLAVVLQQEKGLEVLLEQAKLLVETGNYEGAMQVCREILRTRPKTEEAYLILGYSVIALRKWHDAEFAYQEALRINDKSVDALVGLGIVAFERGRYEDAVAWFERALKVDPNHPIARRNLEVTRRMMKKEG